jgi:hypothetical protein
LHGLVTRLLQFRLGIIEPLEGVIVANLHLGGDDVNDAPLGRRRIGAAFDVGGEVACNLLRASCEVIFAGSGLLS